MVTSKRGFVFVICSLIGYAVGRLFPDGAWAIFVTIMISYHLFLVFLVITAEHDTGFSLPIGSTIVTHLACLAVVVTLGIGRHYIPFFGLIRYFIPAMAPFECQWLFSANPQKEKAAKSKPLKAKAAATAAEIAAVTDEVTGEDYEAWLEHLKSRKSSTRKPGTTLRDEYNQFMLTRYRSRAATASENVSV